MSDKQNEQKIDDGGPAFPFPHCPDGVEPGMSTRTWLAGMAMQGMIAMGRSTFKNADREAQLAGEDAGWAKKIALSEVAFDFADAMLAQLSKDSPNA